MTVQTFISPLSEHLGMRPDLMATGAGDWSAHTAPEIHDLANEDGSVLVVPIGSIEQHGRHLPVATDSLLVSAVAQLGVERVSEELAVLTLRRSGVATPRITSPSAGRCRSSSNTCNVASWTS